MKKLQSAVYLILLSLVTATLVCSQVPEGGIRLNASTGTTFQKIGRCTVTIGSVEDQEFTEAIRVQTGEDLVNAWDAQLKFPAVEGVEAGDAVLVAFYARTLSSEEENGAGFLNVCIEHNVSFEKEIYQFVSIGNEWNEYYAPVQITHSLSVSQVSYLFHMGFISQTVEVADVRFLDYGESLSVDDLPLTETTFAGREPDAAWRAPAEERISRIRKGEMKVRVLDETGEPLDSAEIHIEMVRHQFGFGTAVVADRIIDNKVYRDHLFEMFNEAVFENDLKWPRFIQAGTHSKILRALDTLDAHHMRVRGHCIIWPSYNHMPDFVEDLGNVPEAVRQAVDEHIDEVTRFTEGRMVDWDVMNEPYSEHDLQDMLGDQVMADWYKRARLNDRGVKLFINEYAIISAGAKNKPKQDYLYDLIRYIDSLGGGIDGIGMQGHMDGELSSITKVYEVIDRFASLGKEIKVTEHDINLTQREVQADYTRDFMTIVFSHPSVKSLLLWGFWAGAHWRPDCALFDLDWSVRPHGEVWHDLIRNRWWTPVMDTVTDKQGEYSFDGFLGTYSYRVSDGTSERSGTFTLDHSHMNGLPNTVVISLDPSVPETVQITAGQPGYLCSGEETTLYAPGGEGLQYTWTLDSVALPDQTNSITVTEPGSYRVTVTKGEISLTSGPYLLEVRAVPETEITVEGENTFCEGDAATLHVTPEGELDYEWFRSDARVQWGGTSLETGLPGSYRVVATDNGCSSVSEPVILEMLPLSDPACATGTGPDQSSARLFPNPCRGTVMVDLAPGPENGHIIIELYDATGSLRSLKAARPVTSPFAMKIPGPGLYIVRIIRGETVQNYRLVAE
jgi:endo-1,4-beta-xylanase